MPVYVLWQIATRELREKKIPFTIRRNISFNEPEEQTLRNVYTVTPWGVRLEQTDPSSKQWYAIYYEYVDAHTMRGTPYYDPHERGVVIGEVEKLGKLGKLDKIGRKLGKWGRLGSG